MIELLKRNWWVFAIRGVAGILFGLAALFWPGITLAVLVFLFGAYAILDGVFALVTAFRHRRELPHGWALALEGIAGLAAGAVTWAWPGITALALLFVIAAWAIVTGVFEIVTAIRLRREIDHEWLLALSGIASLVVGTILVMRPASGALALIWLIGAYALGFGALLFALAVWLRVSGHARPTHHAHA